MSAVLKVGPVDCTDPTLAKMRKRQDSLLALLIHASLVCQIGREEWQPPGVLHFEYPERILPEFAVVMAIFFGCKRNARF